MIRPIRQKTIIWLSVAALLSVQFGCAGAPSVRYSQTPPTEEVRANFGTIGVVSARFQPRAEFKGYAKGPGSGALKGSVKGVLTVFDFLAQGEELGIALLIIFAPVLLPSAVLVGALVGADEAEPAKTIRTYEAALKEAVAKLGTQEKLREQVIALMEERTIIDLVLLEDEGPIEPPPPPPRALEDGSDQLLFEDEGPAAPSKAPGNDGAPDYTHLNERGINTVLEVSVLRFGLVDGALDVDPPLAVFMEIRARLVSTTDNIVLYDEDFVHRSAKQKLAVWAEDGARPFGEELATAYERLAYRAVDNIFLKRSVEATLPAPPAPPTRTPIDNDFFGDQ